MNDSRFYFTGALGLVILAIIAGVSLSEVGLKEEKVTWIVGIILGFASLILTQQRTSSHKIDSTEEAKNKSVDEIHKKEDKIQELEESTIDLKRVVGARAEAELKDLANMLRYLADLTHNEWDEKAAQQAEQNLKYFEEMKSKIDSGKYPGD